VSGGADAWSCGIRSGQLWCWGENQIGLATRSRRDLIAVAVLPTPPGTPAYRAIPSDNGWDGYADCIGDCDDTDPMVNPFMPEICNGKDDNCDGVKDEGCP
jgi:hypothetical protein